MNLDLEGHTVRRYDADLNHCHIRVLELGGIVLQQLIEALGALQKWDVPEARTVIERDEGVRQLEKAVDVELVQVIAKRTPVARDLRAVIGMCKMVADLGRVEEKVLRLAEFTASVFDGETSNPPDALLKDLTAMGRAALAHLRQALEIFDRGDAAAAEAGLGAREEFLSWLRSDLRRLTTFMMEDSRLIGQVIGVVLALSALERIAEYTVNLRENVIYQVTGETLRSPPATRDAVAKAS
jgi:phosphate transport system protein